MSAHASGRWRRITVGSMMLAAAVALLIDQASAAPKVMKVKGTFETVLSTGPGCSSPILCVKGPLKGDLKGELNLTAQSAAPTGTAGLTLVNSTSVLHTNDGDLFLATSTVGNLTPGSDGEFSGVDLVTGGTKTFMGASGYLQNRGVMKGTTNKGDYRGKIILP